MKTTPSRLRAWLQLIRPPNLFTVPGDAIAGNLIAGGVPGCAPDLQQVLLPALAVLFLYVGGLIGNDLADLAEDARDRPFRPLPGGRVSCAQARVAAVLCALTGLLLALAASRATFLAAVLTQLAILAYNNWLKHHTWPGALVMGACRGGSVLVGATAAGWPLSPIRPDGPVLAVAIGSMLYIAGVTAIADRETVAVRLGWRRWMPVAALIGLWVLLGMWVQPVPLAGVALAAASIAWAGYQAWQLRDVPLPSRVGSAVGGLIRGLLLVQAGCCAWTGQPAGLLAAIALLALWPVSAAVARWYYAT